MSGHVGVKVDKQIEQAEVKRANAWLVMCNIFNFTCPPPAINLHVTNRYAGFSSSDWQNMLQQDISRYESSPKPTASPGP
jgi:hypothetical protein